MFNRFLTVTALAAVMLVASCKQVNFTAPTGSTITIVAQPPTVAVNGYSNITVTGTRDNGAPLPDGTVVTFTTDLGTVSPNPVETKDGIAVTRFRAGTRSGTAKITASSGEATPVTTEIVVGEARASRVILVASPIQLPVGGGKVSLKAHVYDDQGNDLAGMGVIFKTTAGQLDSQGRVIRSNDSGLATDILRTTVAADVTATTVGGSSVSDTESIAIGQGVPCDFVVSPTDPFVGQTIFFTNQNPGVGVKFFWDFGDGGTAEGASVTHVFEVEGTYTVVHTVVDSQGFSSVCTQTVTVALGVPFCSFTFVPPDPVEGNNVNFDASQSSDPSGIKNFTWSFGDGSSTTVTSPFTNHVYNFPGCNSGSQAVNVGLEVTNNRDQTSFCSQELSIACN